MVARQTMMYGLEMVVLTKRVEDVKIFIGVVKITNKFVRGAAQVERFRDKVRE